MRKRTTNLALTGLAGAMVAASVGTSLAARADGPAVLRLTTPQYVGTTSSAEQPAAEGSPKTAAKKTKQPEKPGKKARKALLTGQTTASYFWDDGSGVNGDSGAPAGGKDMQKGLFASPSWPLGTKVRVTYDGRSVTGFIGDRGPGSPSYDGIMLDLDTYTFRYLLDGEKPKSKYYAGTGEGHLKGVEYEVLAWGDGSGAKGKPQPYGS